MQAGEGGGGSAVDALGHRRVGVHDELDVGDGRAHLNGGRGRGRQLGDACADGLDGSVPGDDEVVMGFSVTK